MRRWRGAILGTLALVLGGAGCADSDGGPADGGPAGPFAIGGTVTDLVGGGLVLRNQGGDDLAIDTVGAFVFPTRVAAGQAYAVTVWQQPAAPAQTCRVTGGSGTVVDRDVREIVVTCTVDTFTIGGTVTGLAGTLVLRNNGGDDLALTTDGPFTFASRLLDGTSYAVTVGTPPPGQTCTVAGGAGAVSGAAVTDVLVTCVDNYYVVAGTILGLRGTVVLQNQGADDLTLTADGAFAFATTLPRAAPYAVTVLTQPHAQRCTVTDGAGVILDRDPSVRVACQTLEAQLLLAEVQSVHGTGGAYRDHLELLVTATGSLRGVTLQEGATSFGSGTLVSFPDRIVEAGDLVVVHTDSAGHPLAGVAAKSCELSLAAATGGDTSATAWDCSVSDTGFVHTDQTLTLVNPAGDTLLDALYLTNADGDGSAGALEALQFVLAHDAWSPAGTYDVTTMQAIGAEVGCLSDATVDPFSGAAVTLQRIPGADTGTRWDWECAPGTFGAPNVVPFTVVGATALANRTVQVTFSGAPEPTAAQDPASYTITGGAGVTVSAAALSGRTVTLTTSAQAPITYTVTVAGVTRANLGATLSVAAADFFGRVVEAQVTLNEVQTIHGTATYRDHLELLVTAPGSLFGITLKEGATSLTAGTIFTFPHRVVQAGDLVVVHTDAAGHPLIGVGADSCETNVAQATGGDTSATAWDCSITDPGFVHTDQTLALVDLDQTVVLDAIYVTNADGAGTAGGLTALNFLLTSGAWLPAGTYDTATMQAIGILDTCQSAATVDPFGAAAVTLQRRPGVDTQRRDDWACAAGTFGAVNVVP